MHFKDSEILIPKLTSTTDFSIINIVDRSYKKNTHNGRKSAMFLAENVLFYALCFSRAQHIGHRGLNPWTASAIVSLYRKASPVIRYYHYYTILGRNFNLADCVLLIRLYKLLLVTINVWVDIFYYKIFSTSPLRTSKHSVGIERV